MFKNGLYPSIFWGFVKGHTHKSILNLKGIAKIIKSGNIGLLGT